MLLLAGCSNTVDVERVVSPAEAPKYTQLEPVAIQRGDEQIPYTPSPDVIELDESGHTIAVRSGTDWTEPQGPMTFQKNDRIVLRGTLHPGDELPDGSKVVLKRQTGALVFGSLAFGLAYIPAAIGGVVSSVDGDHPLAVPLVGPWIMLTTRPACVVDPTVGANCVPDTMARFGAVMSGIFQSLGLVFVIAGLPAHAVLEEPPPPEEKEKTSIQIVPMPNGVGVVGTF